MPPPSPRFELYRGEGVKSLEALTPETDLSFTRRKFPTIQKESANGRPAAAVARGAGEIFGGPWNGNHSVPHAQKICPVARNVKALTSPKNAL